MNSIINYPVIYIEDAKIGGFTAYIHAIKGAIADGDTKEEAFENLKEVISILAEERHALTNEKPKLPKGVSTGSINVALM